MRNCYPLYTSAWDTHTHTQAEQENELSLKEGEELEVQGPEEDGWYPVLRLADGQMGIVPASYITRKPLF